MKALAEVRSPGRGSRRPARRLALRVGAVLATLSMWAGRAEAQQGGGQDVRPAGEVQEVCASCHVGVDAERARALSHPDSLTCLSCHHLGFTNDPAEARQARLDACASCHAGVPATHTELPEGRAECSACHRLHEDPPVAAAPLPAGRCLSCHEEPHPLHAGLSAEEAPSCASCHTLHGGGPVSGTSERMARECASCHADVHPSHPVTPERAPSCTTCHALDAAAAAASRDLDAPETCATCHEEVPPAHPAVDEGAPGCADCHSFRSDPPLPEARPILTGRCAACHEDAMAAYREGGHAEGLETGREGVPDCVSCHPAHDDTGRPDRPVRLAATIRCIQCHSDRELAREYGLLPTVGTSYLEDYHGTTLTFLSNEAGSESRPEVMTCADCHGAHAVVSTDEARVAEVCLRCHEQGDVNLASAWLGHAPPGPGNATAVWLVRLVYFVLIPFILVGLALHIVFHLQHQRKSGARMLETPRIRRIRARLAGEDPPAPATVTRFTRLERLEHFGSMTTFILLVVTGLPQIDPSLGISRWVIGLFGGIGATRLVHRIVGFTFVALLVLHLGRAVLRAVRRRRLPVMVPTRKDFEDTLATLKHFLGGAPRPEVGKFDFSQKFEYWGLLLGGVVISVTGIVLVFPEVVSQLVPGVVVATSRVIHGFEATLAVLTVVLWHSWGVILRPEIFPLDTTIFTGEIEVERLREEHPLEYERLVAEGELAEAPEEGEGIAPSSGHTSPGAALAPLGRGGGAFR